LGEAVVVDFGFFIEVITFFGYSLDDFVPGMSLRFISFLGMQGVLYKGALK